MNYCSPPLVLASLLPEVGAKCLKEPADDTPDHRDAARSNVFLTAVIEGPGGPFPVRIRNISVRGALLEASELPAEGSLVELHRAHLCAKGEVAWRDQGQCGVRFADDIVVAEWVKRAGHAGQDRVDHAIASFRRPVSTEPPGSEPQGVDDLRAMSATLDAICERLARSPDLSVEMAEEVLRLDAIAHALRRFAR